jgi:S1-C subfamily serine protease
MKRLFVILRQKSSMRKLVVTSVVTFVVLLGSVGESFSRPPCPSGFNQRWDNCFGTLEHKGKRYVGEWRNNNMHGRGILTWSDGSKYVGEFRYSKQNGQGTYYYKDGSEYVGEWRNDKRQGQGVLTYGSAHWNAGDKYVGEWWNNKFHGQGVYTYADGRIKKGTWKDNKLQYAQKVSPPTPSVAEKELDRLRRENARLKKRNQSKPKQVAKKSSPKKSSPPKSGTTGSGFFVSKLGHILTNAHVVRNCGSITVGDNAKKQVPTILLETDKRNDLALLKISNTQMASVETKSLIRKLGLKLVPTASKGLLRSDDVELGEDVLVSGYPYGEIYSDTIKVTKGIVSANKGIGDDTGQFQMDAAVQPGNSGGPIYDENGNIVGVVVSQLNKLKFAKAIGSLPENVNFGIKASTVRQFLTASGLPTKWSTRSQRMNTKKLAKIAKNQTVMVKCHP